MSLEIKIEALAAAVTALTAQLQAGNVAAHAPVAPAPAPVVQAAPAPMAAVEIGIILGRVAVCAATHPLSPIIAAGVGRACH